MSDYSVELHIDQIVLRGLPGISAHSVARSAERQLANLLSQRGVPPSLARGGVVPGIDAGALNVPAGASAETVGASVAEAVYRGLNQ